jgi:hypothetical protein
MRRLLEEAIKDDPPRRKWSPWAKRQSLAVMNNVRVRGEHGVTVHILAAVVSVAAAVVSVLGAVLAIFKGGG